MRHVFKVGDQVEVKGADDDDGFKDSWWSARVLNVSDTGATVVYDSIIDSAGNPETEDADFSNLRPVCEDDSNLPLSQRKVGQAVDCFFQDGWWLGYVYRTYPNHLDVYFKGTKEIYTLKNNGRHQRYPPNERPVEDRSLKLRTAKAWDPVLGWILLKDELFEGWENQRKEANIPTLANAQRPPSQPDATGAPKERKPTSPVPVDSSNSLGQGQLAVATRQPCKSSLVEEAEGPLSPSLVRSPRLTGAQDPNSKQQLGLVKKNEVLRKDTGPSSKSLKLELSSLLSKRSGAVKPGIKDLPREPAEKLRAGGRAPTRAAFLGLSSSDDESGSDKEIEVPAAGTKSEGLGEAVTRDHGGRGVGEAALADEVGSTRVANCAEPSRSQAVFSQGETRGYEGDRPVPPSVKSVKPKGKVPPSGLKPKADGSLGRGGSGLVKGNAVSKRQEAGPSSGPKEPERRILAAGNPSLSSKATASRLMDGVAVPDNAFNAGTGQGQDQGAQKKPSALPVKMAVKRMPSKTSLEQKPSATPLEGKPSATLSRPSALSSRPVTPASGPGAGQSGTLGAGGSSNFGLAGILPLTGLEGCAWTQADSNKVLEVLRVFGKNFKCLEVALPHRKKSELQEWLAKNSLLVRQNIAAKPLERKPSGPRVQKNIPAKASATLDLSKLIGLAALPSGGLARKDSAQAPLPRKESVEGPLSRKSSVQGAVSRNDLPQGTLPGKDSAQVPFFHQEPGRADVLKGDGHQGAATQLNNAGPLPGPRMPHDMRTPPDTQIPPTQTAAGWAVASGSGDPQGRGPKVVDSLKGDARFEVPQSFTIGLTTNAQPANVYAPPASGLSGVSHTAFPSDPRLRVGQDGSWAGPVPAVQLSGAPGPLPWLNQAGPRAEPCVQSGEPMAPDPRLPPTQPAVGSGIGDPERGVPEVSAVPIAPVNDAGTVKKLHDGVVWVGGDTDLHPHCLPVETRGDVPEAELVDMDLPPHLQGKRGGERESAGTKSMPEPSQSSWGDGEQDKQGHGGLESRTDAPRPSSKPAPLSWPARDQGNRADKGSEGRESGQADKESRRGRSPVRDARAGRASDADRGRNGDASRGDQTTRQRERSPGRSSTVRKDSLQQRHERSPTHATATEEAGPRERRGPSERAPTASAGTDTRYKSGTHGLSRPGETPPVHTRDKGGPNDKGHRVLSDRGRDSERPSGDASAEPRHKRPHGPTEGPSVGKLEAVRRPGQEKSSDPPRKASRPDALTQSVQDKAKHADLLKKDANPPHADLRGGPTGEGRLSAPQGKDMPKPTSAASPAQRRVVVPRRESPRSAAKSAASSAVQSNAEKDVPLTGSPSKGLKRARDNGHPLVEAPPVARKSRFGTPVSQQGPSAAPVVSKSAAGSQTYPAKARRVVFAKAAAPPIISLDARGHPETDAVASGVATDLKSGGDKAPTQSRGHVPISSPAKHPAEPMQPADGDGALLPDKRRKVYRVHKMVKLCLDNLGGDVMQDQLQSLLTSRVPHIQKVEVVIVGLGEGVYRAGWAVVHVPEEFAASVLDELNKLYLKTDNRPVPRPLLAHYPRKSFPPEAYKGNVEGLKFRAHFAQPNSIEYSPALEWRRLTWASEKAKAEQRKDNLEHLAGLMRHYIEVTGMEVRQDSPPPPPPPLHTEYLWLKGLHPASLKTKEMLKDSFEQWGVREVAPLQDPVTGAFTGHAIVQLRLRTQAAQVLKDLQEMVYIFGSSPRPADAELAEAGWPRGTQAAFDKAISAAFKLDLTTEAKEISLVTESDLPPLERELMLRLRGCLQSQALAMSKLAQQVQGERANLQAKHERVYDQEFEKLMKMETLCNCPACPAISRTGRKGLPFKFVVPDRYQPHTEVGQRVKERGKALFRLPGHASPVRHPGRGRAARGRGSFAGRYAGGMQNYPGGMPQHLLMHPFQMPMLPQQMAPFYLAPGNMDPHLPGPPPNPLPGPPPMLPGVRSPAGRLARGRGAVRGVGSPRGVGRMGSPNAPRGRSLGPSRGGIRSPSQGRANPRGAYNFAASRNSFGRGRGGPANTEYAQRPKPYQRGRGRG